MKLTMRPLILLLCLLPLRWLGAQTTQTYPIHNLSLANPERGWFYSIGAWSNNELQPFPTAAELAALRTGDDKVTLIRRYYLLDDFMNGPIDQSVLDEFQANCDALRTAGFKLIPRFSYNWSYGLPQMDASVQRTHQHLAQLRPYFENNKDVIAHVEAGLIGHFGEWHSSSEGHVDNFTLAVKNGGHQILDSLLRVVPPDRMVATRYYYHNKMKYLENYHGIVAPVDQNTAYSGYLSARVGTHNDAILFDQNWMWHHDSIPEQQAYAAQDLNWVVSSGEPLPSNYALNHNPLPELSFLKFNNLAINANIEGGTDLYDYWKDQGYFDELTLKLGYRFALREATIDDAVALGDTLHLQTVFENTGFGSPYNPRTSEVILRAVNGLEEHVIDITPQLDLRYLGHGLHPIDLLLPLPADVAVGDYQLFLNFPDAEASLASDARYSIELANIGTRESTTGYHTLLHQVAVTTTPLPLSLLSFLAEDRGDRGIQLHWVTEWEENSQGFEIQKLGDHNTWERLAFLPGKGLSTGPTSYTYFDPTPHAATVYYRLKLVDQDQSFRYSPVIAIDGDTAPKLAVYPTLVDDQFTLSGAPVHSLVEVYDAEGVRRASLRPSDSPTIIDLSQFESGWYYLGIVSEGGQVVETQRVFKK